MTYRYITLEREGALTIVTINRPEARNALNSHAHEELAEVFDHFQSDDDQWVAIITATGDKAFCAGHDLKQQASGGGLDTPVSGFAGLTGRKGLNKPVIAAVNGVAMGGGFEIVLACDIAIASETAMFALPEPLVGIAALAGGTQRLPREIGMKRAMGILLTGRRVTAQEGLELGFLNEVVTQDKVLETAKAWARAILACSPVSIQATKEAVIRGMSPDCTDAIADQWAYPAMERLLASHDYVEGPRAFAEKRQPIWAGN